MSYEFAGVYGPQPITNAAGRPLTNLTVNVFLTGTRVLAPLWTDRTKAASAANPTSTDGVGNLSFFADPGEYDIEGNSATITVPVYMDPAEPATGDLEGVLPDLNLDSDAVANLEDVFGEVFASIGGPFLDTGGAVFNVRAAAYGAVGNGTTDDTSALQAAHDAAVAAGGGDIVLPRGDYLVDTAVMHDSPLVRWHGVGLGTKIIAGSSTVPFQANGQCWMYDMVFDGGGLAPHAAKQSVVSESSFPSIWRNVTWQNATDYQYVNVGCEDVVYDSCFTPGNETGGTPSQSIPKAVQILTPFGAVKFVGGEIFGENNLNTQQAEYVGTVFGPLVCNPTGIPRGAANAVVSMQGCYVYDAGVGLSACIDTSGNLFNIEADACVFNMNYATKFVNGNIPAGVTLAFRNCQFTQSFTTGVSISIISASGAGTVVFDGGTVVPDNATAIALFAGISSPTTTVQYLNPISGITTPTGTGFSTTNSVIDDTTGHAIIGNGVEVITSSGGGATNSLALKDSASGNNVYLRANGGTIGSGGGGFQMINDGFSGSPFAVDDGGDVSFAGALISTVSGGGSVHFGAGTPASGLGANGDFYFKFNGTPGGLIYHKSGGAWAGIV